MASSAVNWESSGYLFLSDHNVVLTGITVRVSVKSAICIPKALWRTMGPLSAPRFDDYNPLRRWWEYLEGPRGVKHAEEGKKAYGPLDHLHAAPNSDMLGQCDLQRPACGNCIRARLSCEGYARQWTFVENGPVTRGDATAVVAKRPTKSPPLKFLPHDLSRTAFEVKSMSLFWDLYFPGNESIAPRSRKVGIHFSNWTLAVRRLDLNDSALRPALLALSLARIGESHNDRSVSQQAIELYGTALKEMGLALRDPTRVQSDEILATGKLMAGYEMFHGSTAPELATRGMNWRNHTEGIVKLLEIRGPRHCATKDAHSLVLDTRLAAIITAILARKPNFLATPLWQSLPYESGEEDPSDALFDIMATLPFLVQEFDLLRGCPGSAEVRQRGVQLFYRCRATDRALRQWYISLNAKAPKPLPPAIRSRSDEMDLDNMDTSNSDHFFLFEESDYPLAMILALYWATCNILHTSILTAYAHFRSSGTSEFSQELPEHIDPRRSARSIAHSVEYFLRPRMGILGPEIISFPMGVALMYFMASNEPDDDREKQQLGAMMGRLSAGGLSLGTFLESLRASGHSQMTTGPSEDGWRRSARTWFGPHPTP
ncbi:MAG: hypothetical protein Q9170_000205 [Blastenia crenularia]